MQSGWRAQRPWLSAKQSCSCEMRHGSNASLRAVRPAGFYWCFSPPLLHKHACTCISGQNTLNGWDVDEKISTKKKLDMALVWCPDAESPVIQRANFQTSHSVVAVVLYFKCVFYMLSTKCINILYLNVNSSITEILYCECYCCRCF